MVPQGYSAVPIELNQGRAPLRLCVLVRGVADRVGGRLVVLRDTLDAKVFLGCVTDASGRVREWIEIWVQQLDALSEVAPTTREALTNQILDARWQRQVEAYDASDSDAMIWTGWESENPHPVFLDASTLEPVHPTEPGTGQPWMLCKDDAVLSSRNLPKYSSSLHRYLWIPALGEASPMAPVNSDAPTDGCSTLAEVVGGRDLISFNAGGGLMMVRRFEPLGYQAFVDLLGGVHWDGISHGRTVLDLGLAEKLLPGGIPSVDEGTLLLTGHGAAGRLIECFHLKLRMIHGAIEAAHGMVRRTGRPMLNLTADSFRVGIDTRGSGLPYLWTARVGLVDPGDAVTLSIDGGTHEYFQCGRAEGLSSYRAEMVGPGISGRATLRIRKVTPDGRGVIVEGTFSSRERIRPAANDLVWLRLPIADDRVDLYAKLESSSAMASSEFRFRTLPQRLPDASAAALRDAPGAALPNTFFEILPLLSTPCDLYSLAVLAVATLFTGSTTALDEVLSLARQLADEQGTDSLHLRMAELFERDPRWIESLGPSRLLHESALTPQQALGIIPAEVWFQTLAIIVRMFPGIGHDSACADFGDAPSRGVHKVFEEPLTELGRVLVKTRSLIVVDWRLNREINTVVRRFLVSHG